MFFPHSGGAVSRWSNGAAIVMSLPTMVNHVMDNALHMNVGMIGKGHYANVYEIISKHTQERAALKVVSKRISNQDGVSPSLLLAKEYELLQRLSHPYIVNVMNLFMDNTSIAMEMPLLSSGNLMEYLIASGKCEFVDTAIIGLQLAKALVYLHAQNIAHRDVKPENILSQTGWQPLHQIYLSDFGCHKTDTRVSEGCRTSVGTPVYWSPEQYMVHKKLRAEYGFNVDCWALGVVFFSCCYGRFPFELDDDGDRYRVNNFDLDRQDPDWCSSTSEVQSLLEGMLDIDTERRASAVASVRTIEFALFIVLF